MRAKSCFGLCASLVLLASLTLSASLSAEDQVGEGATSRETMRQAISLIPTQQLNPAARSKLESVVGNPSFFRRLPVEAIDCDPELFVFFVRYPEVLVNMWDVMGISKVQLTRTGPYEFRGSDGAGTACQSELIYGTPDLHIYYGTGKYSGSMLPREVTGKCVCILRSSKAKSASGRTTITTQMDIFLKLDTIGADLLTRTIAPIVGKTADYNFHETAKFVSQVSQACERNPVAVHQMANRLTKCDPKVRDEFIGIVTRIAANSPALRTDRDPAEMLRPPGPPKPFRDNASSEMHASSDTGAVPAGAVETGSRTPAKPTLIMKR